MPSLSCHELKFEYSVLIQMMKRLFSGYRGFKNISFLIFYFSLMLLYQGSASLTQP